MKTLASALILLASAHFASAADQGPVDPVSLQIFVDKHVESIMVDGQLKFIDFDELKSVSTIPVDSHPLIFKGEGFYVACITVIDESGKEYPVDLYIYEGSSGLVVSDITFGMQGREDFRRLAKSGAVKKMTN